MTWGAMRWEGQRGMGRDRNTGEIRGVGVGEWGNTVKYWVVNAVLSCTIHGRGTTMAGPHESSLSCPPCLPAARVLCHAVLCRPSYWRLRCSIRIARCEYDLCRCGTR